MAANLNVSKKFTLCSNRKWRFFCRSCRSNVYFNKKKIIIKLLGYGQLKSANESEFLLSLREHSFDQQIETGSFDVSV